jgi:hypothetical protein
MSKNKEYNQIVNLTKFNMNFSNFIHNNDLLRHTPDYILEKYEHWIGFEPTIEYVLYTPDDMTDFFLKYWKRWRVYEKYSVKVKNILMYLYSTQSMNLLEMSEKFEEYIGPMSMISDVPDKRGIHFLTEIFIGDFLEKNKENMKIVLRNIKIESIM